MKINKRLMRAYRNDPEEVREIFRTARNQTITDRGDVRERIERCDARSFLAELYAKTAIPIFGLGTIGMVYSAITKDMSGALIGPFLGAAISAYLTLPNRKFNGETIREYNLARESALANLSTRN